MSFEPIAPYFPYELAHRQEIDVAIQLADAANRLFARDHESAIGKMFVRKAEELMASTFSTSDQKK